MRMPSTIPDQRTDCPRRINPRRQRPGIFEQAQQKHHAPTDHEKAVAQRWANHLTKRQQPPKRVELAQKLIKLTAELRTVRFDSLNTLATKPVNFENLRKNAKSISDLRLQRRTPVINAFEKASNVLDDKQTHKLHEFIAEWLDEAYEDETEADEAEE
jgi:hypothetical protein